MTKKRVLVVVEWIDAWSLGSWCRSEDHACAPSNCTSAGWLIEKNAKGVKIAARLDLSEGNLGNTSFIPKSCIKKLSVVKGHSVFRN